jgi:hypothetical protein
MDTVDVIQKLRHSLDNLEHSVQTAKMAICKQTIIPTDVLKRILNYEEVICKQRILVDKLIVLLETGKATDAVHLIKVINGLSSMIFDDANELINRFLVSDEKEDAPDNKIYM